MDGELLCIKGGLKWADTPTKPSPLPGAGIRKIADGEVPSYLYPSSAQRSLTWIVTAQPVVSWKPNQLTNGAHVVISIKYTSDFALQSQDLETILLKKTLKNEVKVPPP